MVVSEQEAAGVLDVEALRRTKGIGAAWEVYGRVRYVEYADDGMRFACLVSPLPTIAEGGDPDTHSVVTLLSPFASAYVFEKTGYLASYYVREKLRCPEVYAEPVARLVGLALGRPVG